MGNFFDLILIHPLINILLVIYHMLFFLHIPYPLGFSIIVLTIIIRLILYPLTTSQLKASKKMQDIAPHISNLRAKHKKDAKKLQEETMKLYKQHGVNPAAGCLPVILQLPLFFSLYSVLQKIVSLSPNLIVSEINKLVYLDALRLSQPWSQYFFGLPLGQGPSHLISQVGPLVFLVPLITGLLQFIQSKMIVPPAQKEEQRKEKKENDFASAFQTQSLYIFPIMIGFFSYSFPIGLSLYWNTFTIFGIIQQYKISGMGGLDLKGLWTKKS